MTIEKLDESKLLIALCNKDMERLSITPDTMSLSDPDFKDTVKAILSLAVYESGINTTGRKAVIEAMPYDNGCFLLVSFVSKDGRGKRYRVVKRTRTIFIFETFENIIGLANAIGDEPRLGENTLFEYRDRYYLTIENLHPLIEKTVTEFATRIRAKSIQMSRYYEYGSIISEKKALSTIKRAFKV